MPTSFITKQSFRNVPEQIIEEFNFNGGLITDAHETKLEPTQSPNLNNVVFNDTSSIKTRNGYLRYNNDPIGATSDVSETGGSDGTLPLTANTDYIAQTFIPGTTESVTQVDLYLAMNTSGEEQYVQAFLYATSAGLPTTMLDNGDGQIKLVSTTNEAVYSFRFHHQVELTTATTYAIVLKPFVRGSTQTINQVNVHYRDDIYANGSAITSSDSGLTWTEDTARDLKFNVFKDGDTPVTALMRYYNTTGVQQLIAKVGTGLYRGTDNTGAMTAITFPTGVALDATNNNDWIIVNDTLLLTDGNSEIKKYRGSTNANYTTGTITATLNSATVTGSGTSWSTTTNAEVGEYIQLPDGKWYKITAIASNTSLTIETTYEAATLSGQTYVISPWGEIRGDLNSASAPSALTVPTPNYIEFYSNRVWTLTKNTLNFSVLDTSIAGEFFNDFDTANNSGVINVPAAKGDVCTGLYALGNALFIFQRRAIWAIYGNSPANFELRNITNEIGMLNKRTLVEYNDVLFFLSDKGIYMFDGSNPKNISDGVVNNLIATWANKTSPVATLWENKYLISYTANGDAHNSGMLYYDITRGIWAKAGHIHAQVFSSWSGGTDNGEIYFGSSTTGTIYRWDVGGHDDGYEITTTYDTPSLAFGAGINDKSIKKFFIQQLELGDWDMTVTQFTNISEVETTGTAINLSPGTSSLWDVAEWDVSTFSGEGQLSTERIAEFQGIGKYYKFRMEQTGYDEGIEVLGIIATAKTRRLN